MADGTTSVNGIRLYDSIERTFAVYGDAIQP